MFENYKKISFSYVDVQNYLEKKTQKEKERLKIENNCVLFGFLLGKSSNLHYKPTLKLEDLLNYIWDKITYVDYLYSKKIINYRQKLSLSQILIESQLDKINHNLDKELNFFNGNRPLRVI